MPAFHSEHLLDDFMRLQVAFPALQPARAEFATVSAPDLSGDTQRMAIAWLTVQGRVCRDEHTLDQGMIRQTPEELLSRVASPLFSNQFESLERKCLLQPGAQRLGKIRHGAPIGNP